MSERFNVIFSTRNSNASAVLTNNTMIYAVNWDAILPKRYKKFRCSFVFQSEGNTIALSTGGLVNVNFGSRANVYDGQSLSQNIGIIYPRQIGSNYLYSAETNQNCEFELDYPQGNNVTINLTLFTQVINSLPSPRPYVMILTMTGMTNDEINSGYPDKNRLVMSSR